MSGVYHWRVILRISENKAEEMLIDAQRMVIEDGYVTFWIGSELTGIVNQTDLIGCKIEFTTGEMEYG